MFPDADPLGAGIRAGGEDLEIIGVVADVALTPRGTVVPMAYHSHAQFAADRNWSLEQVVAFDAEPLAAVGALRDVLASTDPDLVLHDPRLLADVIGRGVTQERFAVLLVGAFALLALVLAAIGLYGLLAYAVARRRREIGIRLALGARPAGVRRMVVAQGARLALGGLALGLVAAFAVTRALEALVFEVSVRDPLVFATAAIVLGGVALVASWIPSLGATRVDPAEAFGRE
jgi:predicted lysophospholipase L1 biosynthesis ABC-type transport system permease subunit